MDDDVITECEVVYVAQCIGKRSHQVTILRVLQFLLRPGFLSQSPAAEPLVKSCYQCYRPGSSCAPWPGSACEAVGWDRQTPCLLESVLPLNHHEVYNLPVLDFDTAMPDQPDDIWMVHCSQYVRLVLKLPILDCWEWERADEHIQD